MNNQVSCEKADVCGGATEQCFKDPREPQNLGWLVSGKGKTEGSKEMICAPRRRWMYCAQYKMKLGMKFDKDLGIWILPQWKKTLMRRAKTKVHLTAKIPELERPHPIPNDQIPKTLRHLMLRAERK